MITQKQVNTMSQTLSTTNGYNGLTNDNNSMPLIVNVEENVYLNDQNRKSKHVFIKRNFNILQNLK